MYILERREDFMQILVKDKPKQKPGSCESRILKQGFLAGIVSPRKYLINEATVRLRKPNLIFKVSRLFV